MLNDLTAEAVREVLSYDPQTGVFLWKKSFSNRSPIGSKAGYFGKLGYLRIRVLGDLYMAHRLAWLYVHGVFPKVGLDHINGNPADNRIKNLREANDHQNQGNRGLSKNSGTGLKGVHSKYKGKYPAAITVNRKSIYLGRFATPEEAHAAYVIAANKYFGEFARVS